MINHTLYYLRIGCWNFKIYFYKLLSNYKIKSKNYNLSFKEKWEKNQKNQEEKRNGSNYNETIIRSRSTFWTSGKKMEP